MNKTNQKEQWIFPPGLKKTKQEFDALFKALYEEPDRRKPLMIMGDRGTGKSAFLDIFKRLYLDRNPTAQDKRLNIAALQDTLFISEIFGHKKGSFTGAGIDKKGHLETLGDCGLLMLEELGEMSHAAQAKLLTFIEDGEYYPIGETVKAKTAKNIQIIGTTNKPRDDFREDFFDRFFYFQIPSLYERREDVLYYLKHFLGAAMFDLTRYDLMAIMCYNWPGNVRGIEKLSHGLKWRTEMKEKDGAFIPKHLGVLTWTHELTLITGYKKLQNDLEKFNLSLEKDGKQAFKGRIPDNFDREFDGLQKFCGHTGQEIKANYNLMDLTDKDKNKEDVDITTLTHDNMERRYLEKLLKRTGLNKAEAARRAGLKYTTFQSMSKRYDIS